MDKFMESVIKKIEEHETSEVIRLDNLNNYYIGEHKINRRAFKDTKKPNNRVAHPFGTYISDLLTGYFMGEPVSYALRNPEKASESDMLELQSVFDYNQEKNENIDIAKLCSKFGKAYEIIYIAEDGNIEFKAIDPREMFVVYDSSIKKNIKYAVRYIKTDEGYTIEIYDKDSIRTYNTNSYKTDVELVDNSRNDLSDVPVVEYRNNDLGIGDYELVIPLIDAYDKYASDSLNDFEYFTNAYMAFYGVEMPSDEEEFDNMRDNRLMFLPEGSEVRFVTKDSQGQEIQAHLKRTENDIHKFAKVPNSNDAHFMGNASGVAQQYKLLGTENVTVAKERRFKMSLQRRLKIILDFLKMKNNNQIEWQDITIQFTRNLPVDGLALSEYIQKLKGLVSNRTLLSWLPEIEDVEGELVRLKQEKEEVLFHSKEGNEDYNYWDDDSREPDKTQTSKLKKRQIKDYN